MRGCTRGGGEGRCPPSSRGGGRGEGGGGEGGRGWPGGGPGVVFCRSWMFEVFEVDLHARWKGVTERPVQSMGTAVVSAYHGSWVCVGTRELYNGKPLFGSLLAVYQVPTPYNPERTARSRKNTSQMELGRLQRGPSKQLRVDLVSNKDTGTIS